MKKLLHIVATPRGDKSRTLKVTEAFLDEFKKSSADCQIDTLEVFEESCDSETLK